MYVLCFFIQRHLLYVLCVQSCGMVGHQDQIRSKRWLSNATCHIESYDGLGKAKRTMLVGYIADKQTNKQTPFLVPTYLLHKGTWSVQTETQKLTN